MPIDFLKNRRNQKYLALILGLVLLVILAIVLYGFFGKKQPYVFPEGPKRSFRKIEINFKMLENPALQELQAFEKIPPFEEEVRRENPFLPY